MAKTKRSFCIAKSCITNTRTRYVHRFNKLWCR